MVLLKIFHPIFAAFLITGAVAAMISTADSLLVLSATELSENILKPRLKKGKTNSKALLRISRIVTLCLALVALIISIILVDSKLIFTLVSYVWAGIGGTFSVVILLGLFWKRYHGIPVVITIISGMTFTIVWISSGMDQVFTSRVLTFFIAGIIAILSTLLIPKKK